MKCLEEYTIEYVKEMSPEEVKLLWDRFADENKVEAVRKKLIEVLEIEDANKSLIEN